ncbi:hypothetical protein GIB67_017399 [Kingdonia uniflora]|uniref:LysM domain receptor-like kinase 4 n=1 Tax=Kingdonia uniflora TaxID=39325 RepID=A0A7J7M486_9MAGN|nr:hypothetical protein GIB67_017399 [Kingdonia uniflora]
MARVKHPQEGPPVPNSSGAAKRGRTTQGFKFREYQKEVTLDREELRMKYLEISTIFDIFVIHGWTGIMKPQLSCYPRLVRLFYVFFHVVQGTGIDRTFRVSINGSEFHIDLDDIQKAFGLGESDNPDVEYLEWPPVLSQFPPREEMEKELIAAGKKKGPYLKCKNLNPTLCLFHMVAHRNIIPQKGNKNVLVGNMLYLVYPYSMGLSVDLVFIIMHEMIATVNPDHQTQTLPYSRFISQLLTEMGYVIRPDEEVDAKNEASILSRGYPASVSARGTTTAELTDSEQSQKIVLGFIFFGSGDLPANVVIQYQCHCLGGLKQFSEHQKTQKGCLSLTLRLSWRPLRTALASASSEVPVLQWLWPASSVVKVGLRRINSSSPYIGKATTVCDNNTDNSNSVLGYTCNGQTSRCQAYLIFRSQPGYDTVSSISNLLASNPSQLSQINSVSETSSFANNKEVIVPVNCSCSGEYYQANSSYVIENANTYFSIANDTYQGLSTCQALQDQNHISTKIMLGGTKITVPLRCACPTKNQTDDGMQYLLSYSVTWGDFVWSISTRFGVDTQRTLEANGLSEQENTVYPFTTLLVPLENPPSSSQTIEPPPPPPPVVSPPQSQMTTRSDGKKKSWVYVVIGVSVAIVFVLVACTIVFFVYFHKNKNTVSLHTTSESLESYGTTSKKPEEESDEFLKSLSYIGQTMKLYKFEELKNATENFSPKCLIKGSAYRGTINGNLAAIKRTNNDVSKEINLLNKINHFNLIKLSGVCFNDGHWYLVFEYAANGSLVDWINYGKSGTKVLSWTQRVQISLDVAKGLNYLHCFTDPPHVHKDIKGSNILLDSDFRAKIANLGLATSAKGKKGEFALTRHIVGTKGYMAPEYLENGLVSPKLDIYSFGVVMMEMITGKEASVEHGAKDVVSSEKLTAILSEIDPKENLADLMDPSLQGNYPLDLALFMAKLIESCLRRDPAGRPVMNDIVQTLSSVSASSLNWEMSNNLL